MEFLERLEGDGDEERWLVQNGEDAPHVAWFLQDEDREWLERTERATHDWRGPIHPRVTQIFSVGWHEEHLVVEIEDDRGPLLATAARQLTDPIERERWVVAQFIALADGLAMLRRRRDEAYIHRQLEPDRMYVDVQGHARLRAPIPFVLHGSRPMRMGAGVMKGTVNYLSPEQARGQVLTAASDVFAMASNLHFALSGKRPFATDSEFDTLTAIVERPPHPLETHAPGLARVLERAFAKEARLRFPDPGTFAGELWQCVPDATDYDEVVSDRIVAWCANAASEPSRALQLAGPKCRMTWGQLERTSAADVRHCVGCEQDVVRVRSLSAIVPLLGRHCVSYTGGD